ncbi:conserved protein of unknown function [Denitratisoma oestradiolicum]|uniref:FecR protein domain-containing protein n=1 Tax=Denitratisoma oestradiolicum TaxID=311182 RepID=A0A6S6YUI4_9PROT|nr:FecR family protein [Denitratisoma oestradiolicum]CAB1371094.1 conserved protein of unknown function [Denitratisoma oestradiolicum]
MTRLSSSRGLLTGALGRWAAFALPLLAGLALPAGAVEGEVVFVRGDARLLPAEGPARILRAGDKIAPGQGLQTGKDGYIHIRFPDGGFVGLRPASRFALEAYGVDPASPEGLKVRYRLEQGTVRTITGKAIEQDKSRYRFNTPLAAIGVRGTDYVVQVTDNAARASVNAGTIVLAPFGAGCEAAAQGPCDTINARTLAAMGNAYLEYRAGAVAPEIKRAAMPNGAPTLPEEPSPQKRAEAGAALTTVDPTATATANRINDVLGGEAASRTPAPPPVSEVPPSVVVPEPPPQVTWGRWASIATLSPTVAEQTAKGYESRLSNPLFGLMSSSMPETLPKQGVAGFNLRAGEAYLREGASLTPMVLRDASLTVDFGNRRFDTRLTVSGAGLDLPLAATGSVQWQGYLLGDNARSTMEVVGLLAGPGATEAGYLFDKTLSGGASLSGATAWRR